MRLATALVLLSCTLPVPVRAEVPTPERCPAPVALMMPDRRLDRLAAALAADKPIEILAVGSATTSGQDGSADNAYPARMLRALQSTEPRARFELTVRGAKGLTAADMLPLIKEELKSATVAVVIWQTGTVEAVHGSPPAELTATLETAAAAVRAAGSDLVLVDPPFSRLLRSRADVETYEHVLAEAAKLPGTVLFHRSDLMRDWISEGRLDVEAVAKPDRQATVETLHDCLGAALARFLLNGTAPSQADPGHRG